MLIKGLLNKSKKGEKLEEIYKVKDGLRVSRHGQNVIRCVFIFKYLIYYHIGARMDHVTQWPAVLSWATSHYTGI